MKTIVVIGGSKGIGLSIVKLLTPSHKVISISRSVSNIEHENLTHYSVDVLSGELPDISEVDGLVYCPGSINLKPISRLKIEDFKNDFEINVIGAVKAIQKYARVMKDSQHPSIVLFSTVAVKLGMPFHASIALSLIHI